MNTDVDDSRIDVIGSIIDSDIGELCLDEKRSRLMKREVSS